MTPLRALTDFLASGGIPMMPLIVTAVLVVALAIASWRALDRAGAEDHRLIESRIDAVLFWGFFSAIIGVLGTLGGLAQLAAVIQRYGGSPTAAVVWGGVKVALTTTIAGTCIFAVSLPAWYLLRRRYLRLHSS
jgi:biopolymer transport protein ExbB/TolQ